MAEPVFPTKWHFMVAEALFGVHEQTGELLLVGDGQGSPTWMCWTDLDLARRQLPPGYVLRKAVARDMLRALPAGVGIVIDPATERGLSMDAEYVERVRAQASVFPVGATISRFPWEDAPASW